MTEEVHFEGRSTYYSNPDPDRPIAECGAQQGVVIGYAAPDQVTCARCKLTPAFHAAMIERMAESIIDQQEGPE